MKKRLAASRATLVKFRPMAVALDARMKVYPQKRQVGEYLASGLYGIIVGGHQGLVRIPRDHLPHSVRPYSRRWCICSRPNREAMTSLGKSLEIGNLTVGRTKPVVKAERRKT